MTWAYSIVKCSLVSVILCDSPKSYAGCRSVGMGAVLGGWKPNRTLTLFFERQLALLIVVLVLAPTSILASLYTVCKSVF